MNSQRVAFIGKMLLDLARDMNLSSGSSSSWFDSASRWSRLSGLEFVCCIASRLHTGAASQSFHLFQGDFESVLQYGT